MFNLGTVQSEQKSAYIPAGISENVELTSVVSETITNKAGDKSFPVITFTFTAADGATFIHREFEPKAGDTNKAENMMKRVRHILHKFIGDKADSVGGSSWTEFSDNVVSALGDAHKGVKVRIKLVLNSSQYPSFTPYTGFIEPMSVSPSRLRIGQSERVKEAQADSDLPF